MNKTETAHSQYLQALLSAGEIQWFRFEPLRLVLAHDCTYAPDFAVLMADGTIRFDEVKGGFIMDDAKVKIRVAAQTFPMFCFTMFVYDSRGIKVTEMKVL